MIHELKILPEYYEKVLLNIKQFEVRKNDRNYQEGDWLRLNEWDGEYTGRSCMRYVAYMLKDFEGLAEGYCVMGLKRSAPNVTLD